jgi:multidrug efflux pump subunit AcrA (membrane-fusion protein)
MKKIIIILLIITVVVGIIVYTRNGEESPYTFEKVQKRNIQQTVSVTGSVEADPKVELQFQQSGQIKEIYVEEGQFVEQGTLLASLDNDDLSIQMKATRSTLAYNQAKLDQAIAGATTEEIKLQEIAVEQAKLDLENSEQSLEDLEDLNDEKINAAELTVSKAEINLEKAENDLEYTKKINEEKIETAELDVNHAEEELINSGTSVTNTESTYEQNLNNAYEDIIPKMDNALLTLDENIQAINDILGVETSSIVPTTIKLGSKDSAGLNEAENNYKIAKDSVINAKSVYETWALEKDRESIEEVVNEISESLEITKSALDDTYEVLEKSVTTGETGIASDKKTFMDMIAAEKNSNHTAYSNLRNAYQDIQTAIISEDTNTHTAKTSENTKQNLYEQAVKTLDTITINAENDIKNATIIVQTRQNELDQAKQSYDESIISTEKQENDLLAQIESKKLSIKNAEATLEKLIAPPREVDLRSLQANISKSQADIEKASYNYDQTVLKAPVDGFVVRINKDKGENIVASEVFIIINSPDLLITSNVSETDIAKVKLEDKVTMTFDAFDFSEEFTGQVVEIAPAETVIDGVIYYQVKSSFELENGKEIRSGMTANLKIITSLKEETLAIPLRAVKYEEQKRLVQYLEGEEVKDKEIKTGLEGDQYVEILEGLEEGEEIITFIKYEYSL